MSDELEAQGKTAFEIHQRVINLKTQMGLSFVAMGGLLKQIRDGELFKVLDYPTFTAYVVNSELGFMRRTAYYYIEIFEWFVDRLNYKPEKLAELGYDKLLKLLPLIKSDPENAHQLMIEAESLKTSDFEKRRKDEKVEGTGEGFLAAPEYVKCSCHGKWKIIVPKEDCCPDFLSEFGDGKLRKVVGHDAEWIAEAIESLTVGIGIRDNKRTKLLQLVQLIEEAGK